jgi:glutamyl-tRNA synthetase
MGITHVLRGEDLLSSTPRQIALYTALVDIGVASHIPRFGHLPFVTGEGNKKLSKRDPEANLFHHRDRGFIKEGLLNYLSLLGWSLAPDRDVFSIDEMVKAFDIGTVNPNPARFDLKKAESINGDHIRLLSPEDFLDRCLPYLREAGVVEETLTEREQGILHDILPHVHQRVGLLGEVAPMVAFLFTADTDLVIAEDASSTLNDSASAVLDATLEALGELDSWQIESLEETLRETLVEKMGISPRHAFGPLRVAISGRRVSPPLFESMQVLGRESSMARLAQLRSSL